MNSQGLKLKSKLCQISVNEKLVVTILNLAIASLVKQNQRFCRQWGQCHVVVHKALVWYHIPHIPRSQLMVRSSWDYESNLIPRHLEQRNLRRRTRQRSSAVTLFILITSKLHRNDQWKLEPLRVFASLSGEINCFATAGENEKCLYSMGFWSPNPMVCVVSQLVMILQMGQDQSELSHKIQQAEEEVHRLSLIAKQDAS